MVITGIGIVIAGIGIVIAGIGIVIAGIGIVIAGIGIVITTRQGERKTHRGLVAHRALGHRGACPRKDCRCAKRGRYCVRSGF
jgi:hypothetical protein